MTIVNRIRWLGGMLAIGGTLLLATNRASAQTTTGTLRGYVKDSSGAPLAAAEVQVRNTQTGAVRTTTTNDAGSYILLALPPGTYELTARHIGHSPQARRLDVQIGATQLVDFTLAAGAIQLAGITVQAQPPAIETRTSEVATNVTQQQINDLPTSNRNIFDLAALAPGVVTQNDQINSTRRTFAAGATGPAFGADEINVFIDGASYKNDLLRGGVVAAAATRSRATRFRNSG